MGQNGEQARLLYEARRDDAICCLSSSRMDNESLNL
jgi:hypothetical protein